MILRTRLFIALLSIVTLATCGGSKNSNSPSGSSSGSSTMSATIDGVKWTATSVSADYTAAGNTGSSRLNVVGTNIDQSVGFLVATANGGTQLTPGTYNLVAPNTSNASLSVGLAINAYKASALTPGSSGSITVSTFNTTTKKATGTFNFVMVSDTGLKKTITDGTFSLTYK